MWVGRGRAREVRKGKREEGREGGFTLDRVRLGYAGGVAFFLRGGG